MILVDGIACDGVPADDRGLAFGDGCFETLRVGRGIAPWLARHHARLAATCAALELEPPSVATLADEVQAAAADADRAVVKVIVTRGSGGRGYARPSPTRARRIVMGLPWPDHPSSCWQDGVRVRWCEARIASTAPLAGAKHLGRLTQVLARAEWDDPDIAEGLLLDERGAVVEATASNLFVVLDGELCTPPIAGGAVAGIARGWIMEHAASFGASVAERPLSPRDLVRASELFLCNALRGVWPVRELDGRRWVVGPVTARIRDALAAEGLGP